MDRSAAEPVDAHEYGLEKYGVDGLLASSVNLGRSGLAAALRAHGSGAVAWKSTQPETEICVAICPSNSLVTRSASGGAVVARVMDYIETNLKGDLTIAQLAKIASLSRFYFALLEWYMTNSDCAPPGER